MTWTNMDSSLLRSRGIHGRAISQDMIKFSIVNMSENDTLFKICASNLALVCSYWYISRYFVFFTRGQFWPSGIVVVCVCPCGRQSRACPRDNLWLVSARITKFEPDMQNILVKTPIVFGIDWPWPSKPNLTWKSKFTLFRACPHDHSPPVEVRISKFWPKMYLSSVKILVNFGIDWSWSSNSFSILKPVFLPNIFALFL